MRGLSSLKSAALDSSPSSVYAIHMKILALALGSLAGGFGRYYLSGWIHRFAGTKFPYGTLIVNLLGCFLIGLFAALSERKFLLSPESRMLLMVGFCGAFTTFSTFMLETSGLLRDGEAWRALLNILVSVLAGFLVFRLGAWIGECL